MDNEEIKAGNKIILDDCEYVVAKSDDNSCIGCAFMSMIPCSHIDKCMPDDDRSYIFIDSDRFKE